MEESMDEMKTYFPEVPHMIESMAWQMEQLILQRSNTVNQEGTKIGSNTNHPKLPNSLYL